MNEGGIASLNLLRHPRRLPLLGWPVLGRVLAGGVAGVLCASGWGLWSQTRLAQTRSLQQQLQAELQAQARSRSQASAEAAQARLQQRALARDAQWRLQRERLQQLHGLLAQEARDGGLRLQRWQGDGQRIELQAWLPHTQGLPALQARLSGPAPQGLSDWAVQSLGSAAGEGVQLVLVSTVRGQAAAPHSAARGGQP